MGNKEKEISKETKESVVDKKWFNILLCVLDAIVISFFSIILTILLYYSHKEVSMETSVAVFSIDWTVFGIFIAIAGLVLVFKPKKRTKTIDLFDKTILVVIVINSLVSAIMLMVTTFFVFAGYDKLFMASAFASLYLLSMIFIMYIILLATVVLDSYSSQ